MKNNFSKYSPQKNKIVTSPCCAQAVVDTGDTEQKMSSKVISQRDYAGHETLHY